MYFVFYWIKLLSKIDKMILMHFLWVFSSKLAAGLQLPGLKNSEVVNPNFFRHKATDLQLVPGLVKWAVGGCGLDLVVNS